MPLTDMTATYRYQNFEYRITEDNIVSEDDMIPAGEFNPHNIHPFILHDAGFVVAVVFAEHLQDALDIAADNGRLDRFQVSESEMGDYAEYHTFSEDGTCQHCGAYARDVKKPDELCYASASGISYLGNASEPFDIDNLDVVEVPCSAWTRKYWTAGQLRRQLESAGDRLGLTIEPIGECGMTERAIDTELAKVKACLMEIGKRRVTQ